MPTATASPVGEYAVWKSEAVQAHVDLHTLYGNGKLLKHLHKGVSCEASVSALFMLTSSVEGHASASPALAVSCFAPCNGGVLCIASALGGRKRRVAKNDFEG